MTRLFMFQAQRRKEGYRIGCLSYTVPVHYGRRSVNDGDHVLQGSNLSASITDGSCLLRYTLPSPFATVYVSKSATSLERPSTLNDIHNRVDESIASLLFTSCLFTSRLFTSRLFTSRLFTSRANNDSSSSDKLALRSRFARKAR